MKNLKIMVIGAGLLAMSAVETLAREVESPVFLITTAEEADDLSPSLVTLLEAPQVISAVDLRWELPTLDALSEVLSLKVPIYSVSLPEENKIVLVRDPKGFVERAIRHKMEFIAIKPSDKGEYWELVPVFSVEKSLSFNPKSTVEHASEEDMEMLRIVPVADFLRYD